MVFSNAISRNHRPAEAQQYSGAIKLPSGLYRVYVAVDVQMRSGDITPIAIYWVGRRHELDGLPTDIRHRSSTKAGGAALRYTCQIGGRKRYLFLENDTINPYMLRWYVESPVPEPQDYAE